MPYLSALNAADKQVFTDWADQIQYAAQVLELAAF